MLYEFIDDIFCGLWLFVYNWSIRSTWAFKTKTTWRRIMGIKQMAKYLFIHIVFGKATFLINQVLILKFINMLSIWPPNKLELIFQLPMIFIRVIHPCKKHCFITHIGINFSVCIRMSKFIELKSYLYTLSHFITEFLP